MATAVDNKSVLVFITFWHHVRLLWRIRNHFQSIDSRFLWGVTVWVGSKC